MAELKRCCENCGDEQCANSTVAVWWDECVKSNFEEHWIPKQDEKQGLDFDEVCGRIRKLNRGF